jgi:hypothetical protein
VVGLVPCVADLGVRGDAALPETQAGGADEPRGHVVGEAQFGDETGCQFEHRLVLGVLPARGARGVRVVAQLDADAVAVRRRVVGNVAVVHDLHDLAGIHDIVRGRRAGDGVLEVVGDGAR